jgi:uncharacterized protein YndB with AHSA1/START domain
MAEYEQTLRINTDPDTVFDLVCDVSNMPKYLPTARHAETIGEERIHLHGEAQGRPYDADCILKIDPVEYRMEWEPAGEGRCQGWLAVEETAEGTSELTVHLSLTPGPAAQGQTPAAYDAAVRRHLELAMLAIKNIVESHGVRIER